MTNEEVLAFVQEMEDHFGELPNPEQEPKRFAYYVLMFKYYKSRQND